MFCKGPAGRYDLQATEPQLPRLTPQVRLEQVRLESRRTNNKQVGAAGFP